MPLRSQLLAATTEVVPFPKKTCAYPKPRYASFFVEEAILRLC
jgi:hypothetical protein